MLELRHLATAAAAAAAVAVSFTVMECNGRVSTQINKIGAHVCSVLDKNEEVWREYYRLSDFIKDKSVQVKRE
jgi:hypothetical protein